MKQFFSLFSLMTVILLGGCGTTSNIAQSFFTPDHYNPPEIFGTKDTKISKSPITNKESSIAENASPIIANKDDKSFKLNNAHPVVKKFVDRTPMKNGEFVQIGYLYLLAAESQCEKRVADIARARTANDSGFGILTTFSAVLGTTLATTSGANAASGAAAFFNTLTSNSNSFQTQIAQQYSGDIATIIVKKQAEMVEDREEVGGTVDGLKTKFRKLLAEGQKNNTDTAKQSELHYELNKFNRMCTISAGQRVIGEKLGQ